MILRINVSNYSENWEKLTDEEFREAATALGLKGDDLVRPVKPVSEEGKRTYYVAGPRGLYGSRMVQFPNPAIERVIQVGITVTVEPYKEDDEMIVHLQDEIEALRQAGSLVPVRDSPESFLKGVQVITHVPNLGLLLMNKVKVLTDCCTNELQNELDNGWRILAVCPPNAQRRPDYVMGMQEGVR